MVTVVVVQALREVLAPVASAPLAWTKGQEVEATTEGEGQDAVALAVAVALATQSVPF